MEKPPEPAVIQPPEKNIEIYATLPKTRKGLLSRATKVKNIVEDEEYLLYDRPGRSLNRSKPQTGKKEEKRARSEDRSNKAQKDVVSNQLAKEAKKQAKTEEAKQGKKQHKIRRKLLMGGLIKRKNRSLPDLRDEPAVTKGASKDDTSIVKAEKQANLSGYLSEGHLEYSGNPNLEKSKLMRKSFHGSKIMQLTKVPPPPPVRTSSQLTKLDRPPFPLPGEEFKRYETDMWNREPQSLPPMNHYSDNPTATVVNYAVGGYLLQPNCNTKLVTTAQVHQVSSPIANEEDDDDFQLPPYPSPLGSVSHSRQASEDFPPPPPEEQPVNSSSLLEQLQKKRLQILSDNSSSGGAKSKDSVDASIPKEPSGGDTWLKELQAKQASLREKNMSEVDKITPADVSSKSAIESSQPTSDSSPNIEEQSSSVKDLKSRFEKISVKGIDKPLKVSNESSHRSLSSAMPVLPVLPMPVMNNVVKPENLDCVAPAPSKELKSNLVKTNENKNGSMNASPDEAGKRQKKKSVTFCEQVVLVATAEEDKVDSYIPNPILERVLRSVLHKDSPQEVREVTVQSVVPLKRNDSANYGQCGKRNQEIKSCGSDEIRNSDAIINHAAPDTAAINKAAVPLRAQPSPVLSRQPMRLQPSPMNTPTNAMMAPNALINSPESRLSSLPAGYLNGIENNAAAQRNQYYTTQDQIHASNGYSQSVEGNINSSLNESGSHHPSNGGSDTYGRFKPQTNDPHMIGAPGAAVNQTYGRPPLPPNNLNMNGSLPQSSSYPYTAANLAALHSQIQSQSANGPVYHHVSGIKSNNTQVNSPSNQNGHVQSIPNQNSNTANPNNVGLAQPLGHAENHLNGVTYGSRASPQSYLHRPPSSGSISSCYQTPPVSLPYSQQMMQQAMMQRQYSGQVANPSVTGSVHQPRIMQSPQTSGPQSLRQRVGSPLHFTQGQLTLMQKQQYGEAAQNSDAQHMAVSPNHAMPTPHQLFGSALANSETNHHHIQPNSINGTPNVHNVSISRSLSNSSQHSNQSGINAHYGTLSPDQSKPVYSPYMTPQMPPTLATNRSCYMPVPQKKIIPDDTRRARPQGVYQQDSDSANVQRPDIYQRVPNPEHYPQNPAQYSPYLTPPQPANYQAKYSPYQHPPMPKQDATKPSPPTCAPLRTASCNLCRKKQVAPPAVYCPDCDFYMSRFKPKT